MWRCQRETLQPILDSLYWPSLAIVSPPSKMRSSVAGEKREVPGSGGRGLGRVVWGKSRHTRFLAGGVALMDHLVQYYMNTGSLREMFTRNCRVYFDSVYFYSSHHPAGDMSDTYCIPRRHARRALLLLAYARGKAACVLVTHQNA